MNKVFKKVVALGLAATTILSMTFTASAITVTDKNDDGNFAYSSQYNSKAFGYHWNTATTQALYPELTKSYLSTPRTYISSKTHTVGTMVAMLDKSITTWEDAKNYVKNLTIKDKNGKVLTCRVERDSATGRFGLRALDITYVEYKISKSATNSRVDLKYTLKGLWVGANFNVFVSNVTYTGGGESYKANGRDGFDEADWYTYYTFKSNETLHYKTPQTLTFNAILDKDGKQRNLSTVVHRTTIGSRGVEVTPIKPNVNCFDYAFGFINNPADQDAVFDVCGKVESNYRMFLEEKKGTLFTEDEILKMYTEATIKDFKAACPKGSIRVVSGHDAELKDGEWLVAMRFGRDIRKVTERYYNRINGVMTARYQTYDYYWSDFHYMYRARDGKWYNKHGQLASEECSGNIINPSTDPTDGWISSVSTADIQMSTSYYDSETIYFAVKK